MTAWDGHEQFVSSEFWLCSHCGQSQAAATRSHEAVVTVSNVKLLQFIERKRRLANVRRYFWADCVINWQITSPPVWCHKHCFYRVYLHYVDCGLNTVYVTFDINEIWKYQPGCCKTSVKLCKPFCDTFLGVILLFLCSFDCQIWAIFHFGTLWLWKLTYFLKI